MPADRLEPDQHARGRRGAAGRGRAPTWSRWPGRSSPTRTSSPRRAPGAADAITPCIACNQACLDHTFELKVATCLVNPRACHETELRLPARRRGRAGSPWSAPGRPGSPRRWSRRGRGHRGDALREGRRDRRPAQHGQAHPRQGGVPRPRRLLRPRRGRGGHRARASAGGARRRRSRRVRRGGGRDRRAAARPAASRARSCRTCSSYVDVLRGGAEVGPRVAIVGAGGIGFDVAEFLAQAGPSPTEDLGALAARNGASAIRRDPRRPRRRGTAPRAAGAGDHPVAAQGHQARHGPRQDHRLDPPREPRRQGGAHGRRA